MEAFTFTHEYVETSIGAMDVEFDVQFQIISDETGKECEWEPDHTIKATLFDDWDGSPTDLVIKYGEPLFQEILDLCRDAILDECYENEYE